MRDTRFFGFVVPAAFGLMLSRHRLIEAVIHIKAPQIDTRCAALRFGIGRGADCEYSQQRLRLACAPRRLEMLLVVAHHPIAAISADEMRKREIQAKLRGERAAVSNSRTATRQGGQAAAAP
jgi:hypothetical protein